MKLSEAIREGASKTPPMTQDFARAGATCALGAAMVGLGLPILAGEYGESICGLKVQFKPLLNRMIDCPGCGDNMDVWRAIVELNDVHRWTREQIADWVATLEQPAP